MVRPKRRQQKSRLSLHAVADAFRRSGLRRRGGGLTAGFAFLVLAKSALTANIAAAPWKFARKSARPPDWFRDAWRKIEGSRPCCFPVRAGGETDEGYSQR